MTTPGSLRAGAASGDLDGMLAGLRAFAIPMPVRFRGITVREGALIEGPAGWGEFSPFAEYGPKERPGGWPARSSPRRRAGPGRPETGYR